MDNTTTVATSVAELLADPAMCAWLDSIEEPGDVEIRECLHSIQNIPKEAASPIRQSLQELYQSDIFTEGK